jgi:hypothetical protein
MQMFVMNFFPMTAQGGTIVSRAYNAPCAKRGVEIVEYIIWYRGPFCGDTLEQFILVLESSSFQTVFDVSPDLFNRRQIWASWGPIDEIHKILQYVCVDAVGWSIVLLEFITPYSKVGIQFGDYSGEKCNI